MAAVLALPASWRQGAWMILAGGVVTTLVEYAVHWGYEALLGVRFWVYSRVPGNLQGRVCLPFSVAWGLLAALAIRFLQPAVHFLAVWFPAPVTYGFCCSSLRTPSAPPGSCGLPTTWRNCG